MRVIKTIKCPKHQICMPGHSPYFMERKPSLKNIKEADAKRFGVNVWRPKKDRFGKPIENPKSFYTPWISREEARLRIYNPFDKVCNECRQCVIK